ncbi:MAG: ubiquinone-binding protein [Magnetovibrio sp.]|nr:ubiquinone-binding protein [Magnetovibrio sp.]|tara:strand:- start:448 stop:903 length:456 start_codon:yes stop_codon:yes gene_type:complete
MPIHSEKRVLPYAPEELFNLVKDIEKYPEFLPWCIGLWVHEREEGEMGEILSAKMEIGFKIFRERFTCRVLAIPSSKDVPHRIDVSYVDGPFKYLKNHWVFNRTNIGTEIDFLVDFEFRTKIMEKIIGMVFTEAVQKMVHAFERRANSIYG